MGRGSSGALWTMPFWQALRHGASWARSEFSFCGRVSENALWAVHVDTTFLGKVGSQGLEAGDGDLLRVVTQRLIRTFDVILL